MEVNYLRYFYEVAKSGSFTEAARRLNISQSALSKSVATLEDLEGVTLLERSKKGVRLTPIGAEVFGQSEKLFRMLSEIELTCRGAQEKCEGPLNFGASDHVVNYLLIDSIQKLRAEHPGVLPSVFSGTPNETVDLILRDQIDFGLFFTKVPSSGVDYRPLREVAMAVVCHPSFIKGLGRDVKPARLRAMLRERGFIGSIRAQYRRHPSRELMNLVGEELRIVVESSSQETQKRLCLAGGGVAYLTRFMVEKELSEGTLVEIPLKKPLALPLLLATRKGRELSLNARVFLELLNQK